MSKRQISVKSLAPKGFSSNFGKNNFSRRPSLANLIDLPPNPLTAEFKKSHNCLQRENSNISLSPEQQCVVDAVCRGESVFFTGMESFKLAKKVFAS